MNVWVLGSGSAGNALVLEAGGARVLMAACFPPRERARRLTAVGIAHASIEALVLTYEHHDHARGLAAAARWKWTVYASEGTASSLGELARPVVRFASGSTVPLRTMSLRTVRVAHDAAEPVAIIATSSASGARVGIAHDLGHASRTVCAALSDLDALVIESNHDEGWLRAGPYPPSVRERIAGPYGHLSPRAAPPAAATCAHRKLARVVLAHLSQRCNSPRLAADAMRGALSRTSFRGEVLVTTQDMPLAVSLSGDGGQAQLDFGW